MSASPPLTNFLCSPDPEHPGWLHWRIADPARFNEAVLGKQLVRAEAADTARIRLVPRDPMHTNSAGRVHGAVTLSLIDVSLFAAAYVLRELDAGRSVTLDLSTQFIGAGDATRPLDSVVQVLRETGRLMFLRGTVMQDDEMVAAYSATVRKPSPAK